ncbi:MAG: Fic family protein [Candidatus Algichlamydia australiensis]|nr:Fic family protein [Chlamydiales bacterium]
MTTKTPAGTILKTLLGYKAYVPNPLPPHIDWDEALVNALSRADYILGKLAREGSKLPNPHLLIHPFVTREAVLSSKIEGTQATVGEVLADEARMSRERSADLQEVRNYILALEHGLRRLKEIPLSIRLIKEIHEKLMTGVRGQHATPGEFRRSQNWIGPPGATLNTASYVPPPVDALADCLSDFEKFLHNQQLPPLVHAALCHYQFEAIHPFLDGNGRIGRLLITLLLIERELLPAPLLYLSAFFEASRTEYYRHLQNISTSGTWQEWLHYFLHGVSEQAADALTRAEQINQLINKWQSQATSSLVMEVIQYLAINPFLTTKKIAQQYNVAITTAQRVIQKLENIGAIFQYTEGKRNRLYCAIEILNILER